MIKRANPYPCDGSAKMITIIQQKVSSLPQCIWCDEEVAQLGMAAPEIGGLFAPGDYLLGRYSEPDTLMQFSRHSNRSNN